MPPGAINIVLGHTTSGAEALAKMVPKARVVSAFNTVPSEVLFSVFEARRKGKRSSLVYCGDDSSSKGIAAELIRDVGFDPWTLDPYGSPVAPSCSRCLSPSSRTMKNSGPAKDVGVQRERRSVYCTISFSVYSLRLS